MLQILLVVLLSARAEIPLPSYSDALGRSAWVEVNELVERGRYQEAMACFDQVLELEPGYKKAIKNRNACINKLEEISRSFAEEPPAPGTTVAEEGQDWSTEAHFDHGHVQVGLNVLETFRHDVDHDNVVFLVGKTFRHVVPDLTRTDYDYPHGQPPSGSSVLATISAAASNSSAVTSRCVTARNRVGPNGTMSTPASANLSNTVSAVRPGPIRSNITMFVSGGTGATAG